MSGVFPFVKKDKERFGFGALAVGLLLWSVGGALTWYGQDILAFAAFWVAMMVNMFLSIPDIFDSSKARMRKRLNLLLGIVGCTPVFVYNVFNVDGKLLPISRYRELFGTGDIVFHVVLSVLYFAPMLLMWCAYIENSHMVRKARREAVCMEGPDGKQYRMPKDASMAWRIFRVSEDYFGIPQMLLHQRLADLMYESFQKGGWEIEMPYETSAEQWKKTDKHEVWATYAFMAHKDAANLWERNGQYDKAKVYIDRLTEIALARGAGDDADMLDVVNCREAVYRHFPDSARDKAVDQRCLVLAKKAEAERAAREERRRQHEAEAPKRRAEWQQRYKEWLETEEERLEEEEMVRLEQEERQQQRESADSSYQSETDFSRMPGTIHSTGGKTYRLYHNYGHSVEYEAADDSNDTVTITNVYSRSESHISTNAGTFYF